jgi:hypothetical protein
MRNAPGDPYDGFNMGRVVETAPTSFAQLTKVAVHASVLHSTLLWSFKRPPSPVEY